MGQKLAKPNNAQHDIRMVKTRFPSRHLTSHPAFTRDNARDSRTFFVVQHRSPVSTVISLTPIPTIFPWVAAEALLTSPKTASQREMSLAQCNRQCKCKCKFRCRRHPHLPWIPLQAIRHDALEHIPNIQRAAVGQRNQIHLPVAGRYLCPSK